VDAVITACRVVLVIHGVVSTCCCCVAVVTLRESDNACTIAQQTASTPSRRPATASTPMSHSASDSTCIPPAILATPPRPTVSSAAGTQLHHLSYVAVGSVNINDWILTCYCRDPAIEPMLKKKGLM
jgi:hypothetical protein